MRRVLAPWSPGLVSAFGLLVADVTLEAAWADPAPLSDASLDAERVDAMRARAEAVAREAGLDPAAVGMELGIDLRYRGEAFELTVRIPPAPRTAEALRGAFEAAHSDRYGYARRDLPVEVVARRVTVFAPAEGAVRPPLPSGRGGPAERHAAMFGGRRLEAAFLPRDALAPGFSIEGPAVLEEDSATVVVPPGWRASCLPTGDLMLDRAS